jgi:G3E family GTPase
VRELNSHSPIVEAPSGQVAPELVFGISTQELATLLEGYEDERDAHHQDPGDEPHNHIDQDGIESFKVMSEGTFDPDKLLTTLDNLSPAIFRTKGIVNLTEGKTVLLNRVGQRTDLQDLSLEQSPTESKLIFIGYQINDLETSVSQDVKNCLTAPELVPAQ